MIDPTEIEKMLEKAMSQKNDPRIINENDILGAEDLVRKEKIQKEVKKRRCANCTCSLSKNTEKLAETLTKEEIRKIDPRAYKSGCGSCAKGDAFRCSGCPFRGLPALEEGEAFVFDDSMNDL